MFNQTSQTSPSTDTTRAPTPGHTANDFGVSTGKGQRKPDESKSRVDQENVDAVVADALAKRTTSFFRGSL